MTHNLHLLLHLPLQVFRFGGLDMLNAFPLEGYLQGPKSMSNVNRSQGKSLLNVSFIKLK
jgi:hypothetical protein